MAKVTIEIDDIDDGGTTLTIKLDRNGENENLSAYPATPAMITGLAILDAYNEGGLDDFSQKVVDKVLSKAGFTPEQAKEAEARALAALAKAR